MTGGEDENKAKSGPHWKSSFAGVRCCIGQWKEVRLRNWKKEQVTGVVPSVWFSSLDFVGRQEQRTTPF